MDAGLEFRSGLRPLVLAGLPLLARLPALLVREMLHPPLCNRRQRVSNRGEHRPSHRHDWRRTVVQIGDAGVKVTIEYECPVAGGERRVYCEQVRTALVVVPALPAAMLRITAFRTIMQTQSSEEPLVASREVGWWRHAQDHGTQCQFHHEPLVKQRSGGLLVQYRVVRAAVPVPVAQQSSRLHQSESGTVPSQSRRHSTHL